MGGALLNGVIFGLVLAILIGPVFFALMQTSIDKGSKAGVQMAIGIALSDSLYILVVYFGLSKLIDSTDFSSGMGFIGGVIMLVFGIITLIKKGEKVKVEKDRSSNHDALIQVSKGFFLNGINPAVLFFWIAAVTKVLLREGDEGIHHFIFFAGTILTVLSTDVLKVYVARKLSKFLTAVFLTWLNRVSGAVLVIFGFRLIYKAFVEYYP